MFESPEFVLCVICINLDYLCDHQNCFQKISNQFSGKSEDRIRRKLNKNSSSSRLASHLFWCRLSHKTDERLQDSSFSGSYDIKFHMHIKRPLYKTTLTCLKRSGCLSYCRTKFDLPVVNLLCCVIEDLPKNLFYSSLLCWISFKSHLYNVDL